MWGEDVCADSVLGSCVTGKYSIEVDCVACAAGKFSASFTAAGPLKDMTNVWIWQASTPLRAQRAWTAPQVFTV